MADNSKQLVVKVGKEFTIRLESNPTTGYRWHPLFDSSLKLISNDFIPSSKMIGGSGKECFVFKAVTACKTSIKMVYKRSEKETMKEIEFSIIVS